jgi:8-oxo-dGTP pyrophosphatase MutT (NUDIX family)
MLPTGKMRPRERPVVAAQRELDEEVNCGLSDARLLEFEDVEFWGRRHTTFIVGGICGVAPEPDLREIIDAAFFPLSDLPESISDPTRARLERWRLRSSIPFAVPAFIRIDYVREQMNVQHP